MGTASQVSTTSVPGRSGGRGLGGRGIGTLAGRLGLVVLLVIAALCFMTLPWSVQRYDAQRLEGHQALAAPSWSEPMGTDVLGRSVMWRCLLGGAISLGVGLSAALISVVIGVTWGSLSGYIGGRTDAAMMRIVDVLYGLPYILLVVMLSVAVNGVIDKYKASQYERRAQSVAADEQATSARTAADAAKGAADYAALDAKAQALAAEAQHRKYQAPTTLKLLEDYPDVISVVTLLAAIGGVSWLTMARVIRGQVLSLRAQPFIEAARACGVGPLRVMCRHLLPNLVGPIVVYTTLTVPTAILQESFLSFLGIGIQPPLPSWGNMAADGMKEIHALTQVSTHAHWWSLGLSLPDNYGRWWLLWWPCLLLGLTLMALNFLGDSLRSRFDPRGAERK